MSLGNRTAHFEEPSLSTEWTLISDVGTVGLADDFSAVTRTGALNVLFTRRTLLNDLPTSETGKPRTSIVIDCNTSQTHDALFGNEISAQRVK